MWARRARGGLPAEPHPVVCIQVAEGSCENADFDSAGLGWDSQAIPRLLVCGQL